MRIQKLIASTGVASRREAEQMVLDGRVKVNGEVILRPGHPIELYQDIVLVDGKPLPPRADTHYFALHKPKGCITSRNDPEGRKSVHDLLGGIPHRLEPIGRLDFNTSGLLLFTNDGTLAHQLTHPSQNVPKRYRVKIWKRPQERQLNRLKRGIRLEDGITKPAKLRILEETDTNNTWLEVTVTEGRNKLIRRMFEAIGHPVSKLQRLSFATISLGGLEQGCYRPLSGSEVQRMRDIAGGGDPRNAGKKKRYKKGFAKPKPKKKRLGQRKTRKR
jgi:23S rRNA pseudouridine2605 synthase